MEEAFRALLTGDAATSALVGPGIYWDEAPQGAGLPRVVMYVVSSVPGYHQQGQDALTPARVQIDCQANTTTEKWAVARAVEARLSGYRGTVGAIHFSGIFKTLDRDKTAPDTENNTLRVRQQDWEIWWKSAA